MAITFVQSITATNNGAATSVAATFASNVTAGNAIIVSFGWGDLDLTPTCADNNASYTQAVKRWTANNQGHAIFYLLNAAGGSTTVTASFAGNSVSFRRIIISEYSGVATSGAFDQTNSQEQSGVGSAGTDGISSGNVTTTANNELIYGSTQNIFDAGAGINAGSNYTERVSITGETFTTEDRILATAGTVAATFTHATGNRAMVTAVATFKEAVSASVALTGVEFNFTPGNVVIPGLVALTGVSMLIEAGTVTGPLDLNVIYQPIYRGDA